MNTHLKSHKMTSRQYMNRYALSILTKDLMDREEIIKILYDTKFIERRLMRLAKILDNEKIGQIASKTSNWYVFPLTNKQKKIQSQYNKFKILFDEYSQRLDEFTEFVKDRKMNIESERLVRYLTYEDLVTLHDGKYFASMQTQNKNKNKES